jgi:hypothetical protein
MDLRIPINFGIQAESHRSPLLICFVTQTPWKRPVDILVRW